MLDPQEPPSSLNCTDQRSLIVIVSIIKLQQPKKVEISPCFFPAGVSLREYSLLGFSRFDYVCG